MSAKQKLLQIFRSIGRSAVWKNPRLYRALGLARKRYPKEFDAPQDFFVVGFPRSSNTYCGHFLKSSQPQGFRVLFQLHLPPMIIEVLDRGTPHIFVLRHPKECARSYAVMLGKPVLEQLNYYIDFHTCLLGRRDRLFIVRFEDSTNRIMDVLEAAEKRFSIQLVASISPDEAEKRTQQEILKGTTDPDGTVNHRHFHLPSDERAKMAACLEIEFLDALVCERLKVAEGLHRQFLEHAAKI